jgi:dipeptidyl-peptidase-4
MQMMTRKVIAVTILTMIAAGFSGMAAAQNKRLTYKQAYEWGEPRLMKSLPRIEGWLDDEYYLERRQEKVEDESEGKPAVRTVVYKVNAATGESEIHLDYGRYKNKLPKGFSLERPADVHKESGGFLFSSKGDLYYYNMEKDRFKRLTASFSEEKNARFSPDGKRVAFTREHDLFALDVETGMEKQLTRDGSETVYNGWASWVYYEEILGRRSRYAAYWWSPDSRMIAFLRFDDAPVPIFPLFRADGVHGELEMTRYPKPGDPNPWVRLGIAHLDKQEIVWVDIEEKADHYVAWPFWTPDSRQLFFQWMNRGQDHLILYTADPESGEKTPVYEEKQAAWIEFFTDIHFFRDGSGFLLRSDVDGWAHLYVYDMRGRLKKRLTKGAWMVRGISLVDEDEGYVYFTGWKANSTDSHLFRVAMDGKGLVRLTEGSGTHRCRISPGGIYFIDTFTSINTPQKMDLYAPDQGLVRHLGDSRTPEMEEYGLGRVELFTIPSRDGYDLPALWVLPPDFDEAGTYPVLFQIYGGPDAGSVRNRFPGMSRFYLAQEGIIVISVDHRGSGHFGKEGVSLMHRNLGKWEMHDLIAAVKWLRNKPYVDSTRIGISGGSYGGYTTCMALTYGAGYFTHGIAAYSVTDWRLYDTVYTERYMDTPEENPEGYAFGSVMTHAEKYRGVLLITHGTMDDNVHMQNTIQLIDKFEDMNKDFQLMLYPNARHGVGFPKRNHSVRESAQFWFYHFLERDLAVE